MSYNTGRATLDAMWVKEHVADERTKAVCLVALSGVGRLSWDNRMEAITRIIPGNTFNTAKIGCVCYEAPVLFAVMGFALSFHEANGFYNLSKKDDPNPAIMKFMYHRIVANIRAWHPGDTPIPPGAMVFHGDTDTPYRHVTLSVGHDDVVSCWSASLAGPAIGLDGAGMMSDSYKLFIHQVKELQSKRMSPDTVAVPAVAFSNFNNHHVTLKYTDGPFWDYW